MPTDLSTNFSPQDVIDELVDEALLIRIGAEAIRIIRDRSLHGKYLEGSTGRGYSTTPMPLPMGGIPKTAASAIFRMLKAGDDVRVFQNSRTKALWVVLQGGYKKLRELSVKRSDLVDLTWTGTMWKALHMKVDTAGKSVLLNFSDDRSAEIAGFHHAGAGRSRTKRIFMDLTAEEVSAMTKKVGLE